LSVWLPFAGLICTLSTGLWALARVLQAPVCYLPDGNVLTLEGVTYGKKHALPNGGWWEHLLMPLAPQRGALSTRMSIGNHVSATANALVFWTRLRPGGSSPPSPNTMSTFFSSLRGRRAVGVDDEGHEFGEAVGQMRFFNPYGGLEVMESWELPSFPRRGKSVGLRLYAMDRRGTWERAAEFIVGNPTPGPHPVWTPDPLPITRREGEWEFTLTELAFEEKPAPMRPRWPGERANWSRTRIGLRVTHGGHVSDVWQAVSVSLADATGNLLPMRSLSQTGKEGRKAFVLLGGLSPAEPSWKVRAEFRRRDTPGPTETWSVHGVELPAPGRVTGTDQSATRHGVGLRLMGISAARTRMPGFYVRNNLPTVHLRLTPPEAAQRVCLVRAMDEDGREVAARAFWLADGRCSFGLMLPEGARRVNLTFAVRESRTVEFVARPTRR
jgi:hypothetical protein